MRKIGVIGGLSWVSTADYYRRLNLLTQERLGGVASAPMAIESVDRQAYVDAVIGRGDEDAACAIIRTAAEALVAARAAFIVISCNDVHRFVPQIAPDLPIPFLHIADATAAAVQAAGLSSVAVMGVRKTMEGSFYPEALAKRGIDTLIPNEGEKRYIHDTIYAELTQDVFSEETRCGYVELIEGFARRGAGGAILGCTEIPLLVRSGDTAVPTFSTTDLHCRAAIEMALA